MSLYGGYALLGSWSRDGHVRSTIITGPSYGNGSGTPRERRLYSPCGLSNDHSSLKLLIIILKIIWCYKKVLHMYVTPIRSTFLYNSFCLLFLIAFFFRKTVQNYCFFPTYAFQIFETASGCGDFIKDVKL